MTTATKTAQRADQSVRKAQETLNAHGFPCGKPDGINGPKTRAAVRRFQIAFAGGRKELPPLAVDGVLGPKTERALRELPYLSPHFTAHEARSRGNGNCYVRRELLVALEQLREAVGEPIHVRGMYRDPAHNKRVRGKPKSMHLLGFAADIWCRNRGTLRIERVQRVQAFSGLGDQAGIVLHVDVRHLAGKHNQTPGATPERPARWSY